VQANGLGDLGSTWPWPQEHGRWRFYYRDTFVCKAVVAIKQRPSLWWPIGRAARCLRQWLRQNAGPPVQCREGWRVPCEGPQAGVRLGPDEPGLRSHRQVWNCGNR
jgi:hypothetical protein